MSNNALTGIISIILGTFYYFMSMQIPVVTIGDLVGPRLFPQIVAAIAVISGVLLLLGEIISKNKKKQKILWDFQERKDVYIRIVLTVVAGLIYGFLLVPLGYILSTILFMSMIMLIINGTRRIFESISFCLAFSIITYVAFAMLLNIGLPRGILAF
ncbi:MAG: tripartite tricarboxylate transporter TctB family protein [Syntrophomonadaceae bacterium]|nr:tripartite tricarboxylate transporter TctB family protein [Syntrophomonadaceae bacterium]